MPFRLTIHKPRPTCLSQCSERIQNAELAEGAENEVFPPRSPRAPRFNGLGLGWWLRSLLFRAQSRNKAAYLYFKNVFFEQGSPMSRAGRSSWLDLAFGPWRLGFSLGTCHLALATSVAAEPLQVFRGPL